MIRRHFHLPTSLILLTLLLLPGCGGDDGGNPDSGHQESLAEGAVDQTGGQIGNDTAVLTVPAGALDSATDLALFEDEVQGTLADPGTRVLRVEGLPAELGTPVTLRFTHGLDKAAGDSLGVFLGEESVAYDGGAGLYWHPIAGRDSSGWCIATLTRGARPAGDKSAAALRVLNAPDVAVTYLVDGHIRVVYRTSQVQREPAQSLMMQFEGAFQAMEAWGFEFGYDSGYWPRDVVLCEPPRSWACFIPGNFGRGHFEIEPEMVQPGANLLPVALHEFFHLVQTFYDPRDTTEWGTINQERLWLDEATAAWMEATAMDLEEYYPMGMDGDNLTAMLHGFNGVEDWPGDKYGYGMSAFIRYWLEDENNAQDEDHILHLFEHFKVHGDATDALESVWDPDPTGWVTDMHRKLLAMEIFQYDTNGATWWAYPWDAFVDSQLGSLKKHSEEVADLGSMLCKFTIEGGEPQDMTALKIRAVQAEAGQPAEHLPLTVYGRPEADPLVLLATGVDSLTVADWPTLYTEYKDIMILVTRPFITAPGLAGSRDIELSAEVVFDGSGVDLSYINRVNIEVTTDNVYSNASGVMYNDNISIQADVHWTGSAYVATTASDTVTIPLNPSDLSMGPWSARARGETIGHSYFVRRLAGTGADLDTIDNEGMIFRVSGMETCDRVTEVFESKAVDEDTPPYSYLLSYSCHDGGVIYDQSRVYMHFYRYDP